MTLSSSSHSRTSASRATSPPCSAAGSSRGSSSGRGIDAGNTFRGRPRTSSGSRVRLPKSRTVFEIPNGFGVVIRATATGLPPPGPWFYRCPKRRKTGPEDRFPYSTYLGRGLPESVAGMDGNRTHPGRLSSAPQTVLKTAGLSSANVHQRPRKFNRRHRQSMVVRSRPQLSGGAAVILAVTRSTARANVASPSLGAASLEQLRDTLVGKPQYPTSVTHRQVGTLN